MAVFQVRLTVLYVTPLQNSPTFLVHEQIAATKLEPVLLDYSWNDLHAWAVYLQIHRLPARVRSLIDFLAEAFGETPYWEACLAEE